MVHLTIAICCFVNQNLNNLSVALTFSTGGTLPKDYMLEMLS